MIVVVIITTQLYIYWSYDCIYVDKYRRNELRKSDM